MERTIVCGDLYRHFKGMLYQVIGVAKHSETMEQMVVYQALYGDYSLYVRPLSMFLSEVDREKYPGVTAKYRFTKIERNSLDASKPEFIQSKNRRSIDETAEDKAFTRVEDKTKDAVHYEVEPHPEAALVNENLMAFLDAKDYAEKLEVLDSFRKDIDDRLMSDIEMSLDLPVGNGTLEERLFMVRNNLQTMAKFECRRMR